MIEDKPDYSSAEYCSPKRMASYGYQINEVMSQKPQTLLEIGIGNGVVTYILRRAKIDVTTLDMEKQVKPDVIGSVLALPFKTNYFHGVLCCQVLEHLPLDKLAQALRELWRVTFAFAVVSLPDATRNYRIGVSIPKVRLTITKDVQWKIREQSFDGEHYWEIDKRGFLLPRILPHIREAGFTCLRHYRIWEWPYHRFFVLEKTFAPNQGALCGNKTSKPGILGSLPFIVGR